MKKVILYLTAMIFLGTSPASLLLAKQDDQRSFEKESLQKFQENEEFQYGTEPLPDKPKMKTKNTQLGAVMEGLMYAAIIALIAILVYFVSKNTVAKSSKKIAPDDIPELVDKDIKEVDFDELIRRTAESGDYRKAVRLLYLESLKALDAKKWIKWKLYKTNYEYQLELIGTHLQEDFDQLTYNFEYIWYGHFSIDKGVYQKIEEGFRKFQSGISSKK